MVGAPGRSVEDMTEWLGLPALAVGSRRADRQPDWLDPRVHAHPVRRVGRVLRLLPDPFPAIAESGRELHGGQLARVEVFGDRRGRDRSDSPGRFRDPVVGREGRPRALRQRSAHRSGHRRTVRLEHPLCRPRRSIRPHRHQAARSPVEPAGTRSRRSCRERRRHDAQSALSAREQSRSSSGSGARTSSTASACRSCA